MLFFAAGTVLLTLLVNVPSARLVLRLTGLAETSGAAQHAMALAVARIEGERVRFVNTLRADKFLADAVWEEIDKVTVMQDPFRQAAVARQRAEARTQRRQRRRRRQPEGLQQQAAAVAAAMEAGEGHGGATTSGGDTDDDRASNFADSGGWLHGSASSSSQPTASSSSASGGAGSSSGGSHRGGGGGGGAHTQQCPACDEVIDTVLRPAERAELREEIRVRFLKVR